MWLESVKATLFCVPVLYVLFVTFIVGNRSNDGPAGLFFEILFMIFLLPVMVVLGGIHSVTAWLLFRGRVPARTLIVTLGIIEAGVGLCILVISLGPVSGFWTVFRGVELYTVLSRSADDYWSPVESSPSRASNTSG